ncbi:SpoIIE family protein phosphatase [Cellulomonas sp.]|uniref:SpoIIE family protein phosphatase n=1 Tax=Cellulomonas sp. TaxID=40001 RepID=UPI0028113DAF|nr:SpoIIE family protein phosphatase [Cellulomonas sp.]
MPDVVRSQAWSRAPVALLRLDADGRVLDANATFLGWLGRGADEVVGRVRLADLLSVGGRIYWETHVGPLLRMQRRVDELALELLGAEERLPVLMSARVLDADGDGAPVVEVALSSARDRVRYEGELLAARRAAERAAEQVRVLAETTAGLSSAAGVDDVVQVLRRTALRGLGASGVAVWTAEDRGRLLRHGGTEPDGTDPPDPSVEQLGAGPVHRTPAGEVLVALPGRAELQGVWSLRPSQAPGADPWEPDVLAAVGRQAGVALERARLFDQRSSVAYTLQRALLTTPQLRDPRVSVATAYRPAADGLEVGGDWYDVVTLDDEGTLAVVVGDVVGHGLGAATTMAELRSALRAAAEPGAGAARVLDRLDGVVARTGSGLAASLVYAELAPATGTLHYAVAGHLPPLHLPATGEPRYLWDGRSAPLGLTGGRPRPGASVRLEPGDRLLLCTDGLVERRDRALRDSLAGLRDRAAGLLSGDAPLDALVDAAAEGNRGPRDDVCALLLTWRGADGAG